MRTYSKNLDLTRAMVAYIAHLSVVGEAATSHQLAKKFGVSPSTVRRRLHSKNDTYGIVIDKVPYKGHFKYEYSVDIESPAWIFGVNLCRKSLNLFLKSVTDVSSCDICGYYVDEDVAVCADCESWMCEEVYS